MKDERKRSPLDKSAERQRNRVVNLRNSRVLDTGSPTGSSQAHSSLYNVFDVLR